MIKSGIVLGLLFGFMGFIILSGGCGQQAAETTTTTTPIAASTAVAISGTTATGVSGTGVRTFASLGTAEVKIGYCTSGTDEITVLARGTTSADGTYEVLVAVASLEALKSTSGYVTNLVVEISKEGTTIGSIISSVSPEAGTKAYPPTASVGGYKKAQMALATFKKGKDPKNFDYSNNIDKKFSDDSVKDYTSSKIDAVADSVKSAEDSMDGIIAGLGISAATLEAMKKKGDELHQTYIEPILQAAFAAKTPPNRAAMDAAFASMEAGMTTYALTLGISAQQIADLKSMKNKQFETQMGQESALTGDLAFEESKLRMAGDKMINIFLGQWGAADTLATIAPSDKTKFSVANLTTTATYASFAASQESIKAHLLTLMGTAGTDPMAIGDYMRTAFFDRFIFPPANASKASPEAFFQTYGNNRILIYFMSAFLTQADRDTFMQTTQPAMQAVFQTRFSDTNSSYYMGPLFWGGTTLGRFPTPDDIQTRLGLFNTALGNAIDNSTTRTIIQTNAGFSASDTDLVLKAFRILMAPPDMM